MAFVHPAQGGTITPGVPSVFGHPAQGGGVTVIPPTNAAADPKIEQDLNDVLRFRAKQQKAVPQTFEKDA